MPRSVDGSTGFPLRSNWRRRGCGVFHCDRSPIGSTIASAFSVRTVQRTLAAVVAWSYDLLDESEKQYSAGWRFSPTASTSTAPRRYAGWGTVEPSDVLDLMTRLIDKSLVVAVRNGDDYRYRMLETLRQYGRDQSGSGGRAGRVRRPAACVGRRLGAAARDRPCAHHCRTKPSPRPRHERENLRAVYEQARRSRRRRARTSHRHVRTDHAHARARLRRSTRCSRPCTMSRRLCMRHALTSSAPVRVRDRSLRRRKSCRSFCHRDLREHR